MEDGFRLLSQVVTNEGLNTEKLVKITREDGSIVCPYVQNRRGLVFIRENDYIICEAGNEKHVCGADRFPERFQPVEQSDDKITYLFSILTDTMQKLTNRSVKRMYQQISSL